MSNDYTVIARTRIDNFGMYMASDRFFKNSPDMRNYVRTIERKKRSRKQKGRKK